MATYLQLKTRVQQMAMEADSTEAGAFVNDVYKEIVINTQANPESTPYSLTSGQTSIPVNTTDTLVVMYILYTTSGDTLNQVLEPTTFEEILTLNAVQPTGFIRKYAILGTGQNTTIKLYPAAQTTGDTITVWSAEPPAQLTIDLETPLSLPSQWHYLISLGAATRLIQAVGEDDNLASAYEQKYDIGVAKLKQWIGRRQGNVTQRMNVGYGRNQRHNAHRNDRDVRWSDW